jgi:uncharacterized membrane protein
MKVARKSILHESFRVGISLKGVGGLFEVFSGVVLWLVKPQAMNEIVRKICAALLVDAPHSTIVLHVLNASQKMADNGSSTQFAAMYLVSHGVVKTLLVIALWLDKLWAYPLTIVVFSAFMGYQLHRFTRTHSWALIWLTVFDALIIYLTWQEYQQLQAKQREKAKGIED